MVKDAEQDYMVKCQLAVARLRAIILGFKDHQRNLIINQGQGFLLDICAFSAPMYLPCL
jgi:hypothetical protein